MTVWFDITSLLADPRRSGIQRVQRAILQHWPGTAPLRPCRFDPATASMRPCPPAIVAILTADAPPGGVVAERAALAPYRAAPTPAIEQRGARLFCAELFDDPARAAYYRSLLGIGAPAWLVYDALPWLQPHWYAAGPATRLMPYLRTLRDIPDLAFISAATRADFATRILRRPDPGPVFPLGGDGLGLPRQHFHRDRRDIVMLGAIEPRKSAAAAMRACRQLWSEGHSFRLVMIGIIEHDAQEERELVAELMAHPNFRHVSPASDADIRDALSRARALLFPSRAEGYGLPAVEALAVGITVIAAADLPALQALSWAGQIRLDRVDDATIAEALRRLLDDQSTAALWSEAATLVVPTWAGMVQSLATWLADPSVDEASCTSVG